MVAVGKIFHDLKDEYFFIHTAFLCYLQNVFKKSAKKLYFTTRRFNQLKMLSAQPDYSSVQLIFQQLLWFSVQGWNYPTKISSSRVRDWVQLATPCSIEKVGIESANKKIIRLKFHLNWNSVPARKIRLRSSLLKYKYFIANWLIWAKAMPNEDSWKNTPRLYLSFKCQIAAQTKNGSK